MAWEKNIGVDYHHFKTSYRTNLCGELDSKAIGNKVNICGWVNSRRDHGKLIFIDLRDFSGVIQLVFDPAHSQEAYMTAKKIRSEYVLKAEGIIDRRSSDTINPDIKTGEIEVAVENIQILGKSETPPFLLSETGKVDEMSRLKYRYMDLRTDKMQRNLRMRHAITSQTRNYLNQQGFLEIETPILAKSTPEGARDFLVPSRLNSGKFYALPQSPQLFKQILMFSGFDRVYQIARCFRDEDLRADRQPEFTQIDLEMTFVQMDDVLENIENMMAAIFKNVLGQELKTPFRRITWKQSMETYGSDKPDLRLDLPLKDISAIFADTSFNVFKKVLEKDGCIKSMVVEDGRAFTRKDLDQLIDIAKDSGAGGLVWARVEENEELRSPVTKFLSPAEISMLIEKLNLKPGNLLIIVADTFLVSCNSLGVIRKHLAKKLGLVKEGFEFVWVYDFPLFERDNRDNSITPMHHPFTQPEPGSRKLLDQDPLSVKSQAYDIVLNGQEIGGGSIRINDLELQKKIFEILGFDEQMIEKNFGFFIKAMEYGIPPHGGIALGLDRLVTIIAKMESIRDVIAFPKTQSAVCMLTDSPSEVTPQQLKEAHIDITKNE
ncbi:MAG: aspartate--tRNA ligase [Actinomycetia bacterium]|nr:aspartate--tRNA ligase [Actinomycetes bacterium]